MSHAEPTIHKIDFVSGKRPEQGSTTSEKSRGLGTGHLDATLFYFFVQR